MRHVVVTRVTVALVMLFVACAALFAWRATTRVPPPVRDAAHPADTASPPTGAALFERHCASCHAAGDVIVTAGNRREREAFLRQHGEASADDDRRILDYLEQAK